MRVAVAGGTGTVGTMVVRELEQAGHHAVVLSRAHGVDLTTGKGLADRLHGCDAIIDVVNQNTNNKKAAIEFFGAVLGNLLDAGVKAGVRHTVTLSIVGADKVGLGYYIGKRKQEELVSAGPLPWTILRATQFQELPDTLLDRASGPVVVVPTMLCRPVAASDVAAELVGLVSRPPGGYVRPIAGPEEMRMGEMVKQVARVRGDRKLVLPVRLPGRVGKALAGGALLPSAPFIESGRTFAQHLADLDVCKGAKS